MSDNIYEDRIAALERRVEEIERQQTELKQFERALIKRDYIQTIVMVLAILGASGYLGYQNSLLVGQIDKRIEETNRRIDQMERNFSGRMEQMEKRFEDLKQVVLADRQRRSAQ
jgi:hypothetical protein